MKIKGIDNLDVGMSNIEIEGEVTYTMAPRFVEGDNDRGHYEFYSQFVVIKDETGEIGCSITIEKEEHKLVKGVVARVKGKLEEYKNKKGEMVKKIQGKLIAISKGDRVTDVQQEVAEEYFEEKAKEEKKVCPSVVGQKVQEVILSRVAEKPIDKNDIWEAKDLRIARECAVKAVTELAVAKLLPGKEYFSFANTIVKYIYNGKVVNGILRNNREPLEIIDEDAAFPDEVRKEIEKAVDKTEEEEQGNSYNNALPFTGKKKALKTISKAEDFIPPDKMPD